MKKICSLLLIGALLLSACPVQAQSAAPQAFYEGPSDRYSPAIAQQALTIAELSYQLLSQRLVLAGMGYLMIGDYNMNRPDGDDRHVVGYALYDKALEDGRRAVIVAIRGTADNGEWALNMDLMPSGNYDLPYAENFFLAAQDILDTHEAYFSSLENPVILVTGHSRGAAVANILAAELTDRFGAENVYGYTFATPRTVRGEYPAYGNIFNVINPCDLVTYLPFPEWGFERYGVDLILPVEEATEEQRQAVLAAYEKRLDKLGEDISASLPSRLIRDFTQALTDLMPSVEDGFLLRHALGHPGAAAEDEASMSGWELVSPLISTMLAWNTEGINAMLADLRTADSDFTPAVSAIDAIMTTATPGAAGSAHMPATYGAWLTVLTP